MNQIVLYFDSSRHFSALKVRPLSFYPIHGCHLIREARQQGLRADEQLIETFLFHFLLRKVKVSRRRRRRRHMPHAAGLLLPTNAAQRMCQIEDSKAEPIKCSHTRQPLSLITRYQQSPL